MGLSLQCTEGLHNWCAKYFSRSNLGQKNGISFSFSLPWGTGGGIFGLVSPTSAAAAASPLPGRPGSVLSWRKLPVSAARWPPSRLLCRSRIGKSRGSCTGGLNHENSYQYPHFKYSLFQNICSIRTVYNIHHTVKKSLAIFPSSVGMSLIKTLPGGGIITFCYSALTWSDRSLRREPQGPAKCAPHGSVALAALQDQNCCPPAKTTEGENLQ
jgi:hypothetical protein